MIDISRTRAGLPVIVEDKEFWVSGVVTVIDPVSREVGVKQVFSDETRRFPVEKVHTRCPRPNGHEPGFPRPAPQDRNLLRLLAGYIIALYRKESGPEGLKEVAEWILKEGIAQGGTRAQEIIAIRR